MATQSTTKRDRLDHLAKQIRRGHSAYVDGVRLSLDIARGIGELLHTAKAEVGHGRFREWVQGNCGFSHSSAVLYMRIATEWAVIQSNSQQIANLGVAAVGRWLSERNAADNLLSMRGSLRGHSPEVMAQYRRLLTWCESSLQPGRTETKHFDVLPSLDREELEHARERLVGLSLRVQELVGRIDHQISGEAAAQESARLDEILKGLIEDGEQEHMKALVAVPA